MVSEDAGTGAVYRFIPLSECGHDGALIQRMFTDLRATKLDDRYPEAIRDVPVVARVNIMNDDIGMTTNQLKQLFDQHFAEMTTAPTVNVNHRHSGEDLRCELAQAFGLVKSPTNQYLAGDESGQRANSSRRVSV